MVGRHVLESILLGLDESNVSVDNWVKSIVPNVCEVGYAISQKNEYDVRVIEFFMGAKVVTF